MLQLAFPGSQDIGAIYLEDNMYTIHLLFATWLFEKKFYVNYMWDRWVFLNWVIVFVASMKCHRSSLVCIPLTCMGRKKKKVILCIF